MKVHVYRNYRFIDKDPIIDAMRTVVKDQEGLTDARAHSITGVSNATFHNWFVGETRCPQNATVSQTMAALGYVRRDELTKDGMLHVGFVKVRKNSEEYAQEIEAQADWLLKQDRKEKRSRARKKNGR